MTDSISAFGHNPHEFPYLKPFDLDEGEEVKQKITCLEAHNVPE